MNEAIMIEIVAMAVDCILSYFCNYMVVRGIEPRPLSTSIEEATLLLSDERRKVRQGRN